MINRYTINYRDEIKYKKIERCLKKYNMVAYKKLMFEFYSKLRSGEFIGELISINKYEQTETYDLRLPTDQLFAKAYGEIILNYTVYEEDKVVILNNLEPEEIFLQDRLSELTGYKDEMKSKANEKKEMFKKELLRRLEEK